MRTSLAWRASMSTAPPAVKVAWPTRALVPEVLAPARSPEIATPPRAAWLRVPALRMRASLDCDSKPWMLPLLAWLSA